MNEKTRNVLLAVVEASLEYIEPDGGESIRILDRQSVTVRQGGMTVVAGRSGSGKTTLLNIAAGLISPMSGEVLWAGESVGSLTSAERDRRRAGFIGYVFQDGGLVETLTAAENVALPGIPIGSNRGRTSAASLLASVGLSSRSRHFPDQLSGGEQKRVALARALFGSPPVLILDEPTAGADRRTADEIIGHLRRIVADGHGILVATHDPNLINAGDDVHELD